MCLIANLLIISFILALYYRIRSLAATSFRLLDSNLGSDNEKLSHEVRTWDRYRSHSGSSSDDRKKLEHWDGRPRPWSCSDSNNFLKFLTLGTIPLPPVLLLSAFQQFCNQISQVNLLLDIPRVISILLTRLLLLHQIEHTHTETQIM